MKKQMNHQANISNSNRGTSGSNVTFSKANSNRSKQMNPNNSLYKSK
ncbi:MAG: hypothetical protein LBI72_12510 [Flavobacteriaceae bacterium]|jgi:hypothetical protein|nr:hypothetical protein [Flavobacteriaceae bacterium]